MFVKRSSSNSFVSILVSGVGVRTKVLVGFRIQSEYISR
jgi:hypothetical protein